ncbi:MAG: protein phosphatase 2C domain-containing protein [Planctomycetes bacterium]|nr:protein phosphatase 2C domain-containing protein [Planctomycetota bacterium]
MTRDSMTSEPSAAPPSTRDEPPKDGRASGSSSKNGDSFPATSPKEVPADPLPEPGQVVGGRYQIGDLILQRGPTQRFQGLDHCSGLGSPMPIVVIRQALLASEAASANPESFDSAQKTPIDDESLLADTKVDDIPEWPSLAWEKRLLARTSHLSLPRILDMFEEKNYEYMIEEVPLGRSFWDSWEEEPVSWHTRCLWLIQIAEALEQLHQVGGILADLRPEIVVVTPTRQAVLTDLASLLPQSPPEKKNVPESLYAAPELLSDPENIDARSDLYSFGAMIYSLLHGRELTDLDFTDKGMPRPYLERYPDGHPMLGRLLARTFTHEVDRRFPSRDRAATDPSGFHELIDTLRACSRCLDAIRLDVAGWTNTGVVRSGNEDAIAVLHCMEARLEDSDDFTVIVLADGMGGMASGEVAASMTIQTIRDFFFQHPPFTDLMLSKTTPDSPKAEDSPLSTPAEVIQAALREANRRVWEQGQNNPEQRGMGCTAEVVLIDGKQVWIGHVGDSRTYHARHGRLIQVTHDQTLVSQLVALGQLTEAEASHHPQRSELQQAIGGRRDVYPDQYTLTLETGDWLLVCTDGLSNQLKPAEIISIMHAAGSAEKAARRLVNHAILSVAQDNVSVVVAREC